MTTANSTTNRTPREILKGELIDVLLDCVPSPQVRLLKRLTEDAGLTEPQFGATVWEAIWQANNVLNAGVNGFPPDSCAECGLRKPNHASSCGSASMEDDAPDPSLRIVERETWFDIYEAMPGHGKPELKWLGSVAKSAKTQTTAAALAYFVKQLADAAGNPHMSKPDSITRPCPNPQCSNMIDFTEAECTDCFDARRREQ